MKSIKQIIFLLCFLSIPGLLYSQSLDSLTSLAVKVSPKLKMLQAKTEAAADRIEQNSNLPDPTLTLGLANLPVNTFSFTQEPMTGKVVGLSQGIPFPGKLGAVADVASKDVDIIKQEYNDAKNEIVKNVRQSYYDLSYIRKAISIEKESKKLLDDIANVVRTKYEVSTASQQNLLKVELELTNTSDKIEDLKSKEASITAELNALLLLPADNVIVTENIPDITFRKFTVEELDSLAVQNRAFLKGFRLAREKAVLQENLAKYERYPNFNLSVQYAQRDEIAKTNTPLTDFFTVMVGISLPLNYGGKTTAKIQESESMQEMYAQQYNLAIQVLTQNFGSSVAKLNSLKERIRLIKEAEYPQAQQTFNSALSSYQTGQIDFINVIDSQTKLYQVETSLYRLETDYLKELASLQFLTGTDLTENLK
jgi:outer membrane protein, heavy metal efflux system